MPFCDIKVWNTSKLYDKSMNLYVILSETFLVTEFKEALTKSTLSK